MTTAVEVASKVFHAPFEVKDDSTGSVQAAFSVFNVIDSDGDVVKPSAFTDGQEVPMVWAHRWEQPIGRGVVKVGRKQAVFDGAFFLDTDAGMEAYKTVKNMGNLQEWSFGFRVLEAEDGEFEDRGVQFLKKLELFEVSPVLVGANRETRTVAIKGADEKPFPNEHACRLRDPGDFQADSFRRTNREHEGKRYSVIMGRLEGETTMTEQAYRYPKGSWEMADARSHCKGHEGRFEAASESGFDYAESLLGIEPADGKQLADDSDALIFEALERELMDCN